MSNTCPLLQVFQWLLHISILGIGIQRRVRVPALSYLTFQFNTQVLIELIITLIIKLCHKNMHQVHCQHRRGFLNQSGEEVLIQGLCKGSQTVRLRPTDAKSAQDFGSQLQGVGGSTTKLEERVSTKSFPFLTPIASLGISQTTLGNSLSKLTESIKFIVLMVQ